MKNAKKTIEQVPVYGKDGEIVRTLSVPVVLVLDEVSGEYVYTADSLAAIDAAVAKAADLPLPGEMRALRERLGKSQEAMSRMLRLGAKTWTRWETGVAIPDPANRQCIRMLQDGSLTIYDFDDADERSAARWSPQECQLFVSINEKEVRHESKSVAVAA